jgi:prepilin-type N-terminal cleavage/methylation domain-containing protein
MRNLLQKRKSEGFTIIEVMIVLAIAGLILLIVFLAVPALQRNARNTQSKDAAAAILGAVSEFQNNNNGQLPTGCAIAADGTVTITGAAGTAAGNGRVQPGFTCNTSGTMPGAGTTGVFSIKLNSKCTNNAFAGTATSRAFAVGYNIESASSTVNQCTDS